MAVERGLRKTSEIAKRAIEIRSKYKNLNKMIGKAIMIVIIK